MALICGDGFDHYPTALYLNKWDATEAGGAGTARTISTLYGRLGSQGMLITGAESGGISKNLSVTNSGYGFIGAATYVPSYTTLRRYIFSVMDAYPGTGARTQSTLALETDGSFTIRHIDGGLGGGTVRATSVPGRVSAGTWYYIEWKVKCHATLGAIEVRVDGVTVLTASNINTANMSTGNNWHTRFMIGGSSGSAPVFESTYFDDVYYCDDTGAQNNSFLGDVQLQAIYPNGAGSSTGWTIGGSAPAATNYQSVNEHSPDDDVTYVKSSVVNTLDMYAMDNLSSTASSVKGLLVNVRVKKDDATARTYSTMVKDVAGGGSATAVATRTTPFGAYTNQQDVSELNPTTSAAWTVSEVNSMEAGIKVIT